MHLRYLAAVAIALGLAAAAPAQPARAAKTHVSTVVAVDAPGTNLLALSSPAPTSSMAPGSKTAIPTPSPAPTPIATPAPAPRTIQLSGYGAAAYENYGSQTFATNRVFDTHPDAFNLQAVNIKAQITLPAGFGITAESVFGTDADGLASRGTSNGDGFDLPSAYVSYTKGALTAIVGRFPTLAGAEVYEDPADYNFSRSILYGDAEPFTHTGARISYGIQGGKYLINAGLNNGWDDIKFVGKKKTFEFGPIITISPNFTLAATTYNGQDFSNNYAGAGIMNDGDVGNRTLYDVVLTSKVTSALTLVSNYDNGNQQNDILVDHYGNQISQYGSAHFTGFSQIANYQFSPKFGLAVRGESYHDGGGRSTGVDQYLSEGTGTFAYTPSAPLLFRVEYRVDGANQYYFPTVSNGNRNHQNSIAVETAAKF